jgi:hypothetical protein
MKILSVLIFVLAVAQAAWPQLCPPGLMGGPMLSDAQAAAQVHPGATPDTTIPNQPTPAEPAAFPRARPGNRQSTACAR